MNAKEEQIKNISNWLDTSEYPKDHILYDVKNKKAAGKFKNECAKNNILTHITEVIAIKAKQYAYKTSNDRIIKKSKGITKNCLDNKINMDNYNDTITNNIKLDTSYRTIVSKKHRLLTLQLERNALSGFDDKRYTLEDGINTIPYGFNK